MGKLKRDVKTMKEWLFELRGDMARIEGRGKTMEEENLKSRVEGNEVVTN